MTFYKAIIEWYDSAFGYVQVYWVETKSIGDALEQLREFAISHSMLDVIINQIDPLDSVSIPKNAIRVNDRNMYYLNKIHQFPRNTPFQLPYGIIGSGKEGDTGVDDLTEGYALHEREDGLFELVVVVDNQNLLRVYEQFLRTLDDIRVFWIELQEEWGSSHTKAIYVNEALATTNAVIDYINRNDADTIHNGHVSLTTYDAHGATNVIITDHKIIKVLSYEKERIQPCVHVLEASIIHRKEPLVTIEYGMYHWHYLHPKGRDREAFLSWIIDEGFTQWFPE